MDRSRELADMGAKTGIKMLQHINQALSSVDPQLVMGHVQEAMDDGEELALVLDDLLTASIEGSPVREKAEVADDGLREAMSEGGAALTASESFIKNHVQEMKKHADAMMMNLNAAALPVGSPD